MEATGGYLMENSELSPADVAAYIDGRLSGEERKRVETYLAENPVARQELIETSRVLASMPATGAPRVLRRWMLAVGGLAAAAALLVMVQPRQASTSDRLSAERRPALEQSDRINLVSPATGRGVAPGEVKFVWRPYDSASYRFVISDDAGHVLYRQATYDTTLVVKLDNLANASEKLYWAVDAWSENGSTASSGLTEFEIRDR